MLSAIFQLVRPRQFEIAFKDIQCSEGYVLVRPTFLSICNADQRYYQGQRAEEVLSEKLPMALIHEGIGKVVYDSTNTFSIGQKVVIIPNIPSEIDSVIAENYLRSSKFRASSEDGMLQEYVLTSPDRLIELPDCISDSIAAFTEIVSVSYHAIKRFDKIAHEKRNCIGVWGDGNLGYITAILLKKIFPESQISVFGVNLNKLNDFTFADNIILVNEIPSDIYLDHAFECVGGGASGKAINQIIDYIRPEGTISILGVSEDLVPLNTRMILEKGLRVYGSSRSGRDDFEGVLKLYQQYPDIVAYMDNIVGSIIKVREIKDINKAFETDIHKLIGKTIMEWDI